MNNNSTDANKNDISKYTTIKKGFTYKRNDIYGIIFNKHFYIFLEKCYKTLDKIKFTEKTLNKCIKEISEVLEILRENKYIHNDTYKYNTKKINRLIYKLTLFFSSKEALFSPKYLTISK